ncbi:hypothetical protein VT84_24230 [Gemmata sp. SH-PL17]|uniref:hypothetical protein n=1 Tax=Gemmata sp. SH-PL17 TaxID=1630693 RepID=UPI00078D554C|nr:hypothetical protein [Gemmata sp. SH-PL17]AMV27531.1 hypothetical protein VT84_24230 [Gemmata sp. SH-PL17]
MSQRATSNRCNHPRVLVCVDPNGTEIWRCPVCVTDRVVHWAPPRFDPPATFRERPCHDDEDDPAFENAVRALEDALRD